MTVYHIVFFLLFILALSSGDRCASNNTVHVINMCSNEVKTGSKLYLDINIQSEDNINNCSCILQLPDTERTCRVTFTPFSPNIYWCDYGLTVTDGGLTGTYDCTKKPPLPPTLFDLTPRQTVVILLKKTYSKGFQNFTGCADIHSGTSFTITCSLPNNQTPPTVPTAFISPVTTTDSNTPITSSITSRSTIGGHKADDNTQETQVGAIFGGVVGAIVFIGIIIVIVLVICLRKKRQEKGEPSRQISMVNSGFAPYYANVADEQLGIPPVEDHRMANHYSEISNTSRIAVVKPQPRVVQTEGTYNTVDEPPVSGHYNEVALSPDHIPLRTNNEPTDHYTLVDLLGEDGASRIVNVTKPKPPPPDLATKPKTTKKPKFPVNVKELYAVVNKPKKTKDDSSTECSAPKQVGDIYAVVNKPNKDAQVEYAVVNKNR